MRKSIDLTYCSVEADSTAASQQRGGVTGRPPLDVRVVANRVADLSERVDAIIRHSRYVEMELCQSRRELVILRQDRAGRLMSLDSQVRFLTERLERFEDAEERTRDTNAEPWASSKQLSLLQSRGSPTTRSQQPQHP